MVDFTPIGLVAETPILVVVRRDLAADSMASFIAIAKARGPDLTLGHAGVGSISHISCLLFTSVIGFKPVEVPYRGSALAMTDLIAGRSDFSCGPGELLSKAAERPMREIHQKIRDALSDRRYLVRHLDMNGQ